MCLFPHWAFSKFESILYANAKRYYWLLNCFPDNFCLMGWIFISETNSAFVFFCLLGKTWCGWFCWKTRSNSKSARTLFYRGRYAAELSCQGGFLSQKNIILLNILWPAPTENYVYVSLFTFTILRNTHKYLCLLFCPIPSAHTVS